MKDRVVQAAAKNVIEPIFEADFYPASYGFRPGRNVHGALEHLKALLRPRRAPTESETERRLPYQWVIEGDIRGCFDHISHHGLMNRIRRRVQDTKVNRLVLAFLKSGVLSEAQFLRTDSGTPQGGILSPLLANIALGVIEERYERHAWPRQVPTHHTDPRAIGSRAVRNRANDRRRGRTVFYPIRYCDDFVILVCAPFGPEAHTQAREEAHREKAALAEHLRKEMHLELSEEKTLITPVTTRLRFLGHHVWVRPHPDHGRLVSTTVIPKDRTQYFRRVIKGHFRRSTTTESLGERLRTINPVLRGWANFYRHAWGAKRILSSLDNHVWWTIFRWLKKKHPRTSMKKLYARYGYRLPRGRSQYWRDGKHAVYRTAKVRVGRFRLAWLNPPDFAQPIYGEPGA